MRSGEKSLPQSLAGPWTSGCANPSMLPFSVSLRSVTSPPLQRWENRILSRQTPIGPVLLMTQLSSPGVKPQPFSSQGTCLVTEYLPPSLPTSPPLSSPPLLSFPFLSSPLHVLLKNKPKYIWVLSKLAADPVVEVKFLLM